MIPSRILVLTVALWVNSSVAFAQAIGPEIIDTGTRVDQWWPSRQDALEEVVKEGALVVRFRQVLKGAQSHLNSLSGGPIADCASVGGRLTNFGRVCLFVDNLRRYASYLDRDQACRIQPELDGVTSPTASIEEIEMGIASANDVAANSPLTSLDLFTPGQIPVQGTPPLDTVFPLFEEVAIEEQCAGVGDLRLDLIEVPAASTANVDKLILGYAYLLSLLTWEYNRPYAVATAERIAVANERWTNFERQVLQDQYPWETLIFNDWLARGSTRFTGTLMKPPEQQIRALHPVPTAIVNDDSGETLFRPRLTIEILGLRHFDANDNYQAKRGLSLIATLKADEDESNGWGALYTWKRGSIGIVNQEIRDDDTIGIVFGIDLANQIDSKRNDLMQRWAELRGRLETLGE